MTRLLPKTYQDSYNRRPIAVIKRTFHNIIRRTSGLDLKSPKSVGLPVGFTQDEFLLWTLTHTRFWALYEAWAEHDYAREWAPSIDRLDDTLGYTPGNVRWVKWVTNNKKPRVRAIRLYLTHNGRTQAVSRWAKELGCATSTLLNRKRRGWSDAKTLLDPVRPYLLKAA